MSTDTARSEGTTTADVIRQIREEGPENLRSIEEGSVERLGYRLSALAVKRWIVAGVTCRGGRRIYLSGYQLGRPFMTSWPAVLRFLQEINNCGAAGQD